MRSSPRSGDASTGPTRQPSRIDPHRDGAAGASQLAALAFHADGCGRVRAGATVPRSHRARSSAATSGFFEAARAYERALALWDMVPATDRPVDEDHVELLFETSGAFQTALEPERARDVARAGGRGRRSTSTSLCGPPGSRSDWPGRPISTGDLAGATAI